MRAIITGSTNGIGAAIAMRLATDAWDLTLVGRSDDRLNETAERIRSNHDVAIEIARAEFSDPGEVRDLTERLASGPPADAVVSNAALIAPLEERTTLGIPRTVAVNYIAPYILLRGLAEAWSARPGRFVVVGADPVSLARVPIDTDDLTFVEPSRLGEDPELRPFMLYAHTKNMDAMFTYALARRLRGTRLTINAAHPGVIRSTGLSNETPGLRDAVSAQFNINRAQLAGPDAGADTPAWLATAGDLQGVTGRFFVDREQVETAEHTIDSARCDRLWDTTAQLLGMPSELTQSGSQTLRSKPAARDPSVEHF